MKVCILLIILALSIFSTRQNELNLVGQESSVLQVESSDIDPKIAHVTGDGDVAHEEDKSTYLSFDNPSYDLVDKALESGMTVFSYDLESLSEASHPMVKYIIQFVHYVELLPARSLHMLFILVNNLSIYLESMNSTLEPAMVKVHILLSKNSSTYPLARFLCLLFFSLYSSIIPLLLFTANFVSHTLERSVKGLLIYQSLNFLLWPFTFVPIYFFLRLVVKGLPRFLANPLKSFGSFLYAVITAPWRYLKKGLNYLKGLFFSFIRYFGSFFSKGKKNSQNGKKKTK